MPRPTFPILDKLGGRDRAVEKLSALNPRWNIAAARMWLVRGKLPGDALRDLMRLAEAEGVAYGARDFEIAEQPESEAA